MTDQESRLTFFSMPIGTLDEAKAWIAELHKRDLSFHFEDDPATIVTSRSDKPVFTDEEAPLIRARLDEVYGFEFGEADGGCPIGYMLKVMEG